MESFSYALEEDEKYTPQCERAKFSHTQGRQHSSVPCRRQGDTWASDL